MIESWIDAVQDVFGGISGDGFDVVRAPYLVKRREYPSSIDPKDLLKNPIAFSWVPDSDFLYSAGGPNEGYYSSETHIHVAPDLDPSRIPDLIKWPGLIVAAIAANLKLGGLVNSFTLERRPDAIALVPMAYGSEELHWGFVVFWTVKENVNSSITIATGD